MQVTFQAQPGINSPLKMSGSRVTPEYLALTRSYKAVIEHVKEQPGTICDSLLEKGRVPTAVRDFVRNRSIFDKEKAEKLIDTVLDQVENDRSVYYDFMEILKNEGPWAERIIATLKECFAVAESELAIQQSPVLIEDGGVSAASGTTGRNEIPHEGSYVKI